MAVSIAAEQQAREPSKLLITLRASTLSLGKMPHFHILVFLRIPTLWSGPFHPASVAMGLWQLKWNSFLQNRLRHLSCQSTSTLSGPGLTLHDAAIVVGVDLFD